MTLPDAETFAPAIARADPSDCPICGRDSCAGSEHPLAPVDAHARPRLRAVRATELLTAPRPVEIVEGIARAGCVTVLVSASGGSKTFVLVNVSAAVSDGVPWHGRAVKGGSVLYLSYEGDALGLRLRALRDVAGHRLEHLYVMRASDPLSPVVARAGEQRSIGETTVSDAVSALVAELAAAGRPRIVLVIVDTVRASLAGSEDNSEHVAAYMRVVRRVLATLPDAACILAHHAGWQDGQSPRKRERGSSAWRGNSDTTLYLEAGEYDKVRGSQPLTLRALKVRDDEPPAPLHLIRRRVELAESNERGEPITSCIIERDHRLSEERESEQVQAGAAAQRVLDARILQMIAQRPDLATSQDKLRVALGVRKAVVSDSISRLVQRHLATPGCRGQPYTLTSEGLAMVASEVKQ